MKNKLLFCLLMTSLLLAGCQKKFSPIPPARELSRPESTQRDQDVKQPDESQQGEVDQESSEQNTPPSGSAETGQQFPEGYIELTLSEDLWDDDGLSYRCLGAHNGAMFFYATTESDYHFCSIRAADGEMLYRKSIPWYDAELSFQQGTLFLKTRTEVTALDSTLTEIYRQPVPDTVRTMLENATLSPENLAGFHLPDMYLGYDISANYIYAFADDYGMYLYDAQQDQLTQYITFQEPMLRFENIYYYPDHFWRPQYSHDGLTLMANGISLPLQGGVYNYIFRVSLETGEVERLLSSVLLDERNAEPHYPLEHMGNLSADQGLYRFEYSQGNRLVYRYFVGPSYAGRGKRPAVNSI